MSMISMSKFISFVKPRCQEGGKNPTILIQDGVKIFVDYS